MATDKQQHEIKQEGNETSVSGWSADHGKAIVQDTTKVTGPDALQPTRDQQPGDQGGADRDESDEKTLSSSDNPDAVEEQMSPDAGGR